MYGELAVGVAAGILSGLFGIGGGILMVPVLHYILGHPWGDAVALSLLAIALQSPLGVYQHARRSAVDWRLGALLAGPGLVGVAIGFWLLQRTPVPWVKLAFSLVMLVGAWRMIARRVEPRADAAPAIPMAALGLLAGVASRMFGIGGGLLTVPVMTLLGVRPHVAVGSSLVAVFVVAAVASAGTLASGVPVLAGILLGTGALLGVTVGVRLAHALHPEGLKRLFALGLTGAALYVGLTSGV